MAAASFLWLFPIVSVFPADFDTLHGVKRSIKKDLMIHDLKQEIGCWQHTQNLCEENALRGIKRLSEKYNCQKYVMETPFRIKEGLSLIYFIRKESSDKALLFGPSKVDWTFHCCIGFKDIRSNKDWIIDTSYHYMVGGNLRDMRPKRFIRKDQYLVNIPSNVDIYVIPLSNLGYFVTQFKFNWRVTSLEEFLGNEKHPHPSLLWLFYQVSAGKRDYDKLQSMINRSVVLKFDDLTQFFLPIGNF